MRVAALAFGVLAGLVASLILALGGLDAAALTGVDPRQLSLFRFALFIIANFGVFGAGLVLAAPLAGAILLIVGAFAWIVAAFILHHGPDYVMLTPPGLLLVAAGLALAAFVRRPAQPDDDDEDEFGRAHAAATQRAAIAAAQVDTEDHDEEPSAVPVGASFFGEAGTATSMHGAMTRQPEPPRRNDDDWTPVRRRVEPPRTQPMFRRPDDEEDEDDESGFSRGARLTSSVLSFGLYGALAATAVLVFVNFRSDNSGRASATRIEASAAVSSKATTSSSAPPLQAALAPALETPAAPVVALPSPAAPTLAPSNFGPGTVIASDFPQQRTAAPLDAAPSAAPAPVLAPASSDPLPASEPPPEDLTDGVAGPSGPLMPLAMPPQIAAGRSTYTPPRRAAPAPVNDTGL